MNFMKYVLCMHLLMAPEDDKGGGGGGGDPEKVTVDKKQFDSLMERLNKLEAGGKKDDPPKKDDDPDLNEKARRETAAADKAKAKQKRLESAMKFDMASTDWLKNNEGLVPKDVEQIFATGAKQNYSDAVEKDDALKCGIIQSFFSVQSNLDLLTPALKSQIEEYIKLTPTAKQEKAHNVWETIFEPTLEMIRKVKRAEQLNGQGGRSSVEDAYVQKMTKLSRQNYLGEKSNA